MARQVQQSARVSEDVNLLLFTAWEHGARHVVLSPEGKGTEIRFLDPDGGEHTEWLAVSYDDTVKRLREASSRLGRLHVDMGGKQWIVDAVVPPAGHGQRAFLHMRSDEE